MRNNFLQRMWKDKRIVSCDDIMRLMGRGRGLQGIYLVGVAFIILIMLFKHDEAQSEIGDDQQADSLLIRLRFLLL